MVFSSLFRNSKKSNLPASAPLTHNASPKKQILVIGLDGVPHSLLTRYLRENRLPTLRTLFSAGRLCSMQSVLPTVSSVAWSSFMTGRNPGSHGIYGFIERDPGTHTVYIPTALNQKGATLWQLLSEHGKRVVVINVPLTYPPKSVNGILIADFLCTRFERVVNPSNYLPLLKKHGYQIDVDPWIAQKSRAEFLNQLNAAMRARFAVATELYTQETWDYFQLHIMETDRINHFFWDDMEDEGAPFHRGFLDFYEHMDALIGDFLSHITEDTVVVLMSDHGFCHLKYEFNLNAWLRQSGFLSFNATSKPGLGTISPESTAYSLLPGRIYLQYKGREFNGSVDRAEHSRKIIKDITEGLQLLEEPKSKQPLIKAIIEGATVFHGEAEALAPDLILIPHNGFDLKGSFEKELLFDRQLISGMHTFDDAFFWTNAAVTCSDEISILDIFPTILDILGVPVPSMCDGKSLSTP